MAKLIWYGRAPSGAEVEIHLDPSEIAIEVEGSTKANPKTRAPYPTELFDAFKRADSGLASVGFKGSDRFARPTYGGGGGGHGKGKRPDLAPPPGIVVPEHCGAPAKYIVYNKDNVTARAREALAARGVPEGKADMWVCSKDKACEDVTSGKSERPWAGFDMKPIPKPAEAKPAAAPTQPATPAPGTTPPPPPQAPAAPPPAENAGHAAGDAAWASFDAKAEALGYSQETIREIAGTIPVVRGETTRPQLEALLAKMKAAPRKRGA